MLFREAWQCVLFQKRRTSWCSIFCKQAKTLLMPLFGACSPKAWTLVRACLVPHPCAVSCLERHKSYRYQCFAHSPKPEKKGKLEAQQLLVSEMTADGQACGVYCVMTVMTRSFHMGAPPCATREGPLRSFAARLQSRLDSSAIGHREHCGHCVRSTNSITIEKLEPPFTVRALL